MYTCGCSFMTIRSHTVVTTMSQGCMSCYQYETCQNWMDDAFYTGSLQPSSDRTTPLRNGQFQALTGYKSVTVNDDMLWSASTCTNVIAITSYIAHSYIFGDFLPTDKHPGVLHRV